MVVVEVIGVVAVIWAVVATAALVRARAERRRIERTLVELVRELEAAVDAGAPAADPVPGAGDLDATRALARLRRALREADLVRYDAEAIRAHLERALNAIPQGVIIAAEDGRVVARNDVAVMLAEARHGDALVQAAVEELLTDALGGLPARRTVELFEAPRRTLVISATPLDEGGRLTGALVVVDDISERRRLDAVRRDFVANISHELKTPVAAMSLLAEALVAEDDPETSRRLGERILTEAFRVNRTIEDLLALSRIETEEDFAQERVLLAAVVEEAAARIRPAAEQAGISIGIDVDDPDHLAVDGDRRQLVSALYNLLDNAVKYSEGDTTIEVTAGAEPAGADGDPSAVLSVTDHGIGIPARDLERVFERFYRVDQARSRETGGTGLGLAIVRHVVRNHGGEVEVSSRTGVGSTFTLRFPTVAPREAVAPLPDAEGCAIDPGPALGVDTTHPRPLITPGAPVATARQAGHR